MTAAAISHCRPHTLTSPPSLLAAATLPSLFPSFMLSFLSPARKLANKLRKALRETNEVTMEVQYRCNRCFYLIFSLSRAPHNSTHTLTHLDSLLRSSFGSLQFFTLLSFRCYRSCVNKLHKVTQKTKLNGM